ncbi:hypothetical protein ACJJTC_015999 [Scirpophaga incertulas]
MFQNVAATYNKKKHAVGLLLAMEPASTYGMMDSLNIHLADLCSSCPRVVLSVTTIVPKFLSFTGAGTISALNLFAPSLELESYPRLAGPAIDKLKWGSDQLEPSRQSKGQQLI